MLLLVRPLTTSIDNVTSSYKSVVGLIDQNTAANTTWNLYDTVNPAANSPFALTIISKNGETASGYVTTGVTTLNIRNVDAVSTAVSNGIDVAGLAGLKTVNVQNASVIGTTADTFTVSSIAAGTTLQIQSNGQYQNVTGNYASTATAGTADTVTLSLAGRNGAINIGAGFETAAITTYSTGNREASLTFNSTVKAVTVAGGDFRVDSALDSAITGFDASAATGTVNVTVNPGSKLTAVGGTSGTDVINVQSSSATGTGLKISGFETIALQSTSGTVAFDTTNFSGETAIGVQAGGSTSNVANPTNIAAAITTANFAGNDTTGTGSVTFNGLTWGLKTATGLTDAVTFNVNNSGVATTGTLSTGAITANAVESVTINTADAKAVSINGITGSASTTANVSLKVSGTSNLTLGTVALTSGSSTAPANTYDFSGHLGTLSLTVSDASALSFTGGAGNTTVTTGALTATTAAATYTLGAGTNTVNLTQTAAAASSTVQETITGGAGVDTFNATVGNYSNIGVNTNTTGLNKISIDGGEGVNDTLAVTLAGTAAGTLKLADFKNIEIIQVTGTAAGTNSDLVDLTVATGYAETVTINQLATVSSAAVNVNFNTATAGTIDTTNIKFLGATGSISGKTAGLSVTGSSGNDTITASKYSSETIFSSGGSDTINLIASASRTSGVVDTINVTTGTGTSTNGTAISNYVFGSGKDLIDVAGTAAAWNTAITGWTITNGVLTKTGATVADFYAAVGGVTTTGEVAAFASGGNTYVFASNSTGTTDDGYVTLVGVTATAVATTGAATTVLIG